MKKLLFICCAVFLLLGLSGCTDREPLPEETESTEISQETTQQTVKEREITLGYFENKGFNPYKTESPLNRSLLTLVYDSLFLHAEGYSVTPLIALSCEAEENKLTVKINTELVFSDGAPITPSDVAYSFSLAKESSFYSARLSDFLTATASSSSVIFTVKNKDIFAESCLTFPIVKYGTGDDRLPIGSGRYVIKKDGEDYLLKANKDNSRKEEMTTEKIKLIPVSAEKGELYLLQTGDLTYFFDDLSDGEYTKIGANMIKTPLNNLVFIGLNSASPLLQDSNVLKAINHAVDKTALCDSVYEGMYRKPKALFNPDWYAAASLKEYADSYDVQRAEELLEKSGYIYAYSHNEFRSKDFVFMEMTLLVCSDTPAKVKLAEEIKAALEKLGISITLEKKEYSEYKETLEKGEFDLYVGEIKLSANMDLSPFFSSEGGADYGIDTASVTAKAYYDFKAGKTDISTFAQVFEGEMPFIPLCYRDGMSYYSRELSYEGAVNEYEPFRNIYSWEV